MAENLLLLNSESAFVTLAGSFVEVHIRCEKLPSRIFCRIGRLPSNSSSSILVPVSDVLREKVGSCVSLTITRKISEIAVPHAECVLLSPIEEKYFLGRHFPTAMDLRYLIMGAFVDTMHHLYYHSPFDSKVMFL